MNVANLPGAVHLVMQIPKKSLKAMVENSSSARWAIDAIHLGFTPEVAPKESIESANVVHVKMGEEQCVNRLNLGKTQVSQTAVAAIEEQAFQ
jgi:hypothetical protein